MQMATAEGLRPAGDSESQRCHITCIHAANDDAKRMLVNMWSHKSPPEALKLLASKDVSVTNESDKQQQLPKLRLVNDQVRSVMGRGGRGGGGGGGDATSGATRHAQAPRLTLHAGESPPQSPAAHGAAATPEKPESGGSKRRLHHHHAPPSMTPVSEADDWRSMGSAGPASAPPNALVLQQVTDLSESVASLSRSSQQQIVDLSRAHSESLSKHEEQLAELSKAHSVEMAKMGHELAALSQKHSEAMLKMAELISQRDGGGSPPHPRH